MQLLILGSVIVDVGPFSTDPDTGDLHNDRGTFNKHVLDAGGAWRIADIADGAMPVDFALGKYSIDVSNVFTSLPAQPAPAPIVPESVDMLQARVALFNAGKLDAVQPAIDAITDATQRTKFNIFWNYSSKVYRKDTITITLGEAIGLSSADMDSLFVAAQYL